MNRNDFPQNGHVGLSCAGAIVDEVPVVAIKLGGEGGAEDTNGCPAEGGPDVLNCDAIPPISPDGGPLAEGGPDGNFPFFLLASNPPPLALGARVLAIADLLKKNEVNAKKNETIKVKILIANIHPKKVNVKFAVLTILRKKINSSNIGVDHTPIIADFGT